MTSTAGSKVTFDVTDAGAGGRSEADSAPATPASPSSTRGVQPEFLQADSLRGRVHRPATGLVVTLGDSVSAPSLQHARSTSTSGTTLRVLQYNTHHGGYGTDGRYDTNRLADWIVKMKPDVVLLNEIEKYTGWGNQNQPEVYKSLLQSKTGKTWYYIFAQEFGDWSSNGKGNLILSTCADQVHRPPRAGPQRRSQHRRGDDHAGTAGRSRSS